MIDLGFDFLILAERADYRTISTRDRLTLVLYRVRCAIKNNVSAKGFSVFDDHWLTIGIKSPSFAFCLNDFSGIVLLLFVSFAKDVHFIHTITVSFDFHQYGVMKNPIKDCTCRNGVSQEFRTVIFFHVCDEYKGLFLFEQFINELKKAGGILWLLPAQAFRGHFIQNFK